MKVEVKARQTIFDIAIQECGSVEAVVGIARLNNISITDPIEVGTMLLLPPVINSKIVAIYKNKGIIPATDIE